MNPCANGSPVADGACARVGHSDPSASPHSGQGFTIFVGVMAFLASMFFIITLFFGDRMGPVGKYQHVSLLFFGALWVLFYFISGIVMAVNAFNSSGRAASAFSFLSVPVWGLLSYYAFKSNSVPLPFGGRSSAQPTVSV